MKKITILIGFILIGLITFSQDYWMTNDGSATTCSGNFYDSGGPDNPYGNNENFTFTFTPATPGAMLQFDFSYFKTHHQDILYVYNGSEITTTPYKTLYGTHNSGFAPITANNPDGALTFHFESNKTMNGWEADISCVTPVTNDVCADAMPINEVTDLAFSTGNATASGKSPTCGNGGNDPNPVDLWYAYTATMTGEGYFDLNGSLFHTRLAIWNSCNSGTSEECDVYEGQQQPSITMDVIAGDTYYVQVGGKHSDIGIGDLTINVFFPGVWTGNISTDWGTAGNWYDGHTPYQGTDVTIPSTPSGGYFPETNSGAGAVCDDLLIHSGAHLDIPSDNSLTVNGTLTNNAGIAGLVIKSDASGTASLIHNSSNVDATVERYLIDARWHFIGIPVSSAMAGVFHLPSGHSDIYLRTHNEATNSWGSYIVPVSTPLELGRGYETWVGTPGGFTQPETITFTGALNSGDYTTGVGGFYGLQYTTGQGLNLISNPYPSALEANLNMWSNNTIANKVWTWSMTYGNYVFWGSGDDYGGGFYGTMTGGVIPAMQGFFVEAYGPNPSLTIPQADRIHSSQEYYKESWIPNNTIRLEVDANNYKDIIFVTFNSNATEGYDLQYDVKKLFGLVEAPQLYSMITGQQLSINALPELKEYHTVQLGFECGLPGTYTINASEVESFDGSVSVYLEDTKKGLIQDLSSKASYIFDYKLSDDPTRFVLHFGEQNGINELDGQNVKVYTNNNVVYIQKPAELEGTVFIYNMMGQEIYSQKAENEELIYIPVNNGTGYYVISVQSDNNIVTQKVFIR